MRFQALSGLALDDVTSNILSQRCFSFCILSVSLGILIQHLHLLIIDTIFKGAGRRQFEEKTVFLKRGLVLTRNRPLNTHFALPNKKCQVFTIMLPPA